MRKKQKLLGVAVLLLLALTACRKTTSVTKDDEQDFQDRIEALEISGNHVTSELIKNVSIDADITPSSLYGETCGVYEFRLASLDITTEQMIDAMNEYFGEERVHYEDSEEYLLAANPDSEELPKIICYTDKQGGSASYSRDVNELNAYSSFFWNVYNNDKEMVKTSGSEELEKKADKLRALFGDKFTFMKDTEAIYLEFSGKEDYEKLDEKLKNDYWESKSYLDFSIEEEPAFSQGKAAYAVFLYEMPGNGHIPLKVGNCSFKDMSMKGLPETSEYGQNGEVYVNCDNYIMAYFDENLELVGVNVFRQCSVEETPVKQAEMLDAGQAVEKACEILKSQSVPVKIIQVTLSYTGVIREEDGKLEDYLSPVWEVEWSCPALENVASTVRVDAVTGEVL